MKIKIDPFGRCNVAVLERLLVTSRLKLFHSPILFVAKIFSPVLVSQNVKIEPCSPSLVFLNGFKAKNHVGHYRLPPSLK